MSEDLLSLVSTVFHMISFVVIELFLYFFKSTLSIVVVVANESVCNNNTSIDVQYTVASYFDV